MLNVIVCENYESKKHEFKLWQYDETHDYKNLLLDELRIFKYHLAQNIFIK